MDGFKKRLNASIELKLSFSLSLAILLVAVVAGVLSFVSAFGEAHELQDDTLGQVAALIDRNLIAPPIPGQGLQSSASDQESRVVVQYLADSSVVDSPLDATAPLPIPNTLADGLHTLDLGEETLRVLVKTMASGRRIAVAQETGVRDEIARDSAFRTVLPFLVLVPILLVIVADLVRKMFRPIALLSAEIDERAETALEPVNEAHLPIEVRPFIVAINRLLARVAQSVGAQRRFVADAAHELRSPLTAMSLQAQRLAEVDMPPTARERLTTLQQGIDRSRNLMEQLLTLAKIQAGAEQPVSTVSLRAILGRVLEDLMPLAEAKRIDLGVEGQQDAHVTASALDLIVLVKNLVDNAIRYTPAGGRVDIVLALTEGNAALMVKDTGPGIPLGERERVFSPFYRVLGSGHVGSGLGLSIVAAIAQRIGAKITLACTDEAAGLGLCVCVHMPTGHDCPPQC